METRTGNGVVMIKSKGMRKTKTNVYKLGDDYINRVTAVSRFS